MRCQWCLLLPFGKSIQMLILSNVLYLALLMWSMMRLGKRCNSPLLYTYLLTPAVFGEPTRFEPNFANVAMTSLGLLCLVESNCFQNRKWSLAWGIVFGSALMLDRLTVLFYLGQRACMCLQKSNGPINVFVGVFYTLCFCF